MWWWRIKIHSSWLLALGSAGFVIGVSGSQLHSIWPGYMAVAAIGLLACFANRSRFILPFLCIASVAFGWGYGSLHVIPSSVYGALVGASLTLQGKVKEDPSKGTSGSYSVQLHDIKVGARSYPGSVFASMVKIGEAKRGDIVTIKGVVGEGFGNFPASIRAVSFSSVVRPVPGDVGRVVRDWFAAKVREVVPEPQASLGIGFLTGQKSALPVELSESLKIAGLTHIVVASGYNLTILVRMARRTFVRVSKYMSAVFSGVMIVCFMAITGLSPSMTRAGLVSGLSLMAWYYGHALNPFVLLPLAAAITIAINPSYAWGDLGWQLSFAAFAGVMIVAPLLQRYFFGDKEPGVLRQILGETVAAHIVTIPIIALSFGVISNVAVIANILVVPLVPLAMLLTFICGIWSITGLPFSALAAIPTDWLLSYMVTVATFVSELSWAQSELSLAPYIWGLYSFVVVAACFWMWRATKFRFTNGVDSMT